MRPFFVSSLSDTRICASEHANARGSVHNSNLRAVTADSGVARLDPSRRLPRPRAPHEERLFTHRQPYKFSNINNIPFPFPVACSPFTSHIPPPSPLAASGIRRVRRSALSENLWPFRQKHRHRLAFLRLALAFNT